MPDFSAQRVSRPPRRRKLVWRVCAILIFVAGLGAFAGGLLYWIQQKYRMSRHVAAGTTILLGPKDLDREVRIRTFDRVEYNFWPLLQTTAAERQDMLRACLDTVQDYLRMGNIPAKSEFIWQGRTNIPLMVRHYAARPWERIEGNPTGTKSANLVEVDGVPTAQILVGITGAPDLELCLFLDKESGKWKLDWQQFARFQPVAWEEFLRGEGPDTAQFRLWLEREFVDDTRNDYAIRLVAPGLNGTHERSGATTVVYVPKLSDLGKELYKLFEMNKAMVGSKGRVLNASDPEELLRARVVITRTKLPLRANEYKFTIIRLIGEGWYGLDIPEGTS